MNGPRECSTVGNPRTEARVRATPIVMRYPLARIFRSCRSLSGMTWSRHSLRAPSDQALAERVRLRHADRCFQDAQIHRSQCVVNSGRKHGIAIVHDKPVRFFACQHAPELLHGPLGRRMSRDIPMQNPTGADVSTRNTYTTRKVAVTTTKKSHASVSRAWFRTNVRHVCDDERGRDGTAAACTGGRFAAIRRRPTSAAVPRQSVPHPRSDSLAPWWRSRPAGTEESGDGQDAATSNARIGGIPDGATAQACRVGRW